MTKRQLKNRLKVLFQQLELMNRYPESFLENIGKRGIENTIDDILDEINEINRALKKINNQ